MSSLLNSAMNNKSGFLIQMQFLSACKRGELTVVRELLQRGAEVESMDEV